MARCLWLGFLIAWFFLIAYYIPITQYLMCVSLFSINTVGKSNRAGRSQHIKSHLSSRITFFSRLTWSIVSRIRSKKSQYTRQSDRKLKRQIVSLITQNRAQDVPLRNQIIGAAYKQKHGRAAFTGSFEISVFRWSDWRTGRVTGAFRRGGPGSHFGFLKSYCCHLI